MLKRQTRVSASGWTGWKLEKGGTGWEGAQGTQLLPLKPVRIHLVLTPFRKNGDFQTLTDKFGASPVTRFKGL